MQRTVLAVLAGVTAVALSAAALLWPNNEVQAQIGLPVGVADCSCTAGTQLQGDAVRTRVHICQCGAQQCVISVSWRGSDSAPGAQPQLAQSCR
ncbi:MAG: hypothetical protein MUC68_02740 [Burkholderiaceae bacterium]|jgi:hypothetical protein|nr:hypothetical protein [Burkholderiaceae bacterium]